MPWYAWVGADTKAEFLRGFFLKHNVGRFLQPMENHRGGVLYYLLILLAGFAPWSVFFAPVAWHFFRSLRPPLSSTTDDGQRTTDKYRFLGCWVVVYLLFFSVSRTELPNYVLPLYPACRFWWALLERWRRGEIVPPAWLLPASLASLCLAGVLTAAGLLFAGGAFGTSCCAAGTCPVWKNGPSSVWCPCWGAWGAGGV